MSKVTAKEIVIRSIHKGANEVARNVNNLSKKSMDKARELSKILTDTSINVETDYERIEKRYNLLKSNEKAKSILAGCNNHEMEKIRRMASMDTIKIPESDAHKIVSECSTDFNEIVKDVVVDRINSDFEELKVMVKEAASEAGFNPPTVSKEDGSEAEHTFEDNQGRVLTARTKISSDNRLVIDMMDIDGSLSCDENLCEEKMKSIWKYLTKKGVQTDKINVFHLKNKGKMKKQKSKIKKYLQTNKQANFLSTKR